MKTQFQKEVHVRNEKANKPDYKERFAEEGEAFNRGGLPPTEPCPLVKMRVQGDSIIVTVKNPHFKPKPQAYLEHLLRREGLFSIRGYESKMGWGLKAFQLHNRLQGQPVEDLHKKICADLEDMFRITVNNLLRSEPKAVNSQGREKLAFFFKSGLVPIRLGQLETKDFIFKIDFFNAKSG